MELTQPLRRQSRVQAQMSNDVCDQYLHTPVVTNGMFSHLSFPAAETSLCQEIGYWACRMFYIGHILKPDIFVHCWVLGNHQSIKRQVGSYYGNTN